MKNSIFAGLLVCFVAASVSAESITLFGQKYDVQRFDYAEELVFPNPNPEFAGFFPYVAVLEAEAVRYVGNDQLVMISEKMSALSYKSIAVLIDLEFDAAGDVSGLAVNRVLFWQDPPLPPTNPGFDLSPSGIAINTGTSGLAAGGNLLITDTENSYIHGYDVSDASTLGFRVPWNPELEDTDLDYGGWPIHPDADEPEDIVYVPEQDLIYIIQEDELGNYGGFEMVSFTPDGQFVDDYVIAQETNGKPKGLSWLPDSCAFPPMFHGLGGLLMVSYDDDGPGLEVFDLNTNSVAYEPLIDSNGAYLVDPGTQLLNIEAIAADPVSGRLFLVQQGDVSEDNFFYVLTPYAQADVNADGVVDFADFDKFADCHAGPGEDVPLAECAELMFKVHDFDCDGDVDLADYGAFQLQIE